MTDVAVIIGANRTEAESQLWDVIELEIKLANVSITTQIIYIDVLLYKTCVRYAFLNNGYLCHILDICS